MQVMAWCCQTTSHYLSQCGISSVTPYGITRPQGINTLRPRRNEQHFADDIFKHIFFNENVGILIKISLKFVRKGPISNIPALVQIMAWHCSGNEPLSELMMISLPMHISVRGLNELNNWVSWWCCSLETLYLCIKLFKCNKYLVSTVSWYFSTRASVAQMFTAVCGILNYPFNLFSTSALVLSIRNEYCEN